MELDTPTMTSPGFRCCFPPNVQEIISSVWLVNFEALGWKRSDAAAGYRTTGRHHLPVSFHTKHTPTRVVHTNSSTSRLAKICHLHSCTYMHTVSYLSIGQQTNCLEMDGLQPQWLTYGDFKITILSSNCF
jgi:hypothetical protein